MNEITLRVTYHPGQGSKRYDSDIIYSIKEAINWIHLHIVPRGGMNYREHLSADRLVTVFERNRISIDEVSLIALMQLAGFETKQRDGKTYFNISDKSDFLSDSSNFNCI